MKGQRDRQTIEIKEAQKTINDFEKQISAKISELEQEKTQRAAGEDQLKGLAEELAAVKGQRDRQTIEIKEAQKTINDFEKQISAKISELEQEKTQRSWRRSTKGLAEELAAVKGQRDTQTIEIKEAQKTINDLEKQISANISELEQEKTQRAAGEDQLKSLAEELAAVSGTARYTNNRNKRSSKNH